MTELIAIAALGLGAYYLAPSYSVESTGDKNALELREAHHTGFIRGTNASRTGQVTSEETRVIRTPNYSLGSALNNAAKAWAYYKEKNDFIANMTNGVNVLINQATIRPTVRQRPGLLQLPSREAWSDKFGDIANVTYDINSGEPADNMTLTWRDQYGDAGGFPREGRPNPVLNEMYVGNPWGPGGQLFEAVGNQYRDPQYADAKPDGVLKKGKSPARILYQNRVRWQQ